MQKVWMESGEITYEDPLKVSDFVDDSFAKDAG